MEEEYRTMTRTVIRKLIGCVISLFVISVILYSVFYFLGGDSSSVILSEDVTETARKAYIAENASPGFLAGYLISMWRFFSLRWGTTINGENIRSLVLSTLSVSLSLSFYAFLFSFPFSLFFSVVAVKRRGMASDILLSLFSYVFLLLPSFLVSIILVLVFSSVLHLLPVAGYAKLSSGYLSHIRTLILPSLSLSLLGSSYMLRIFRKGLGDTMNQGYINYARAKGIKEKDIVLRSALKPTLPLIISTTAQCMISFIASSTVVETVFALPGFGRALVKAAMQRDGSLSFVLVMIMVLFITSILFISSVLIALVDKRGEKENGMV